METRRLHFLYIITAPEVKILLSYNSINCICIFEILPAIDNVFSPFCFSNVSCLNDVTIGGKPCAVIDSTDTVIRCSLVTGSGVTVGVPLEVSVTVRGQGQAVFTPDSDLQRRCVLLL